jgi:hypothetical protein
MRECRQSEKGKGQTRENSDELEKEMRGEGLRKDENEKVR